MCSKFSTVPYNRKLCSMFDLYQEYQLDKSPNKVDAFIGTYYSEEGKPWILPVVAKVKTMLAKDKTVDHEYLGALGLDAFCSAAVKLLLGQNNEALVQQRAFAIQTTGSAGAIKVGGDFLFTHHDRKVTYVPDHTWDNHIPTIENCGYTDIRKYRYLNEVDKCVDFEGMCDDLSNAPEGSVILLQGCGHNPSSCDINHNQWKTVAEIIKKQNLLPFFDCAYLGFVSGDFDYDAWPVRYFADHGIEFLCALSFSKTFGLYGERVGSLIFVLNSKECVEPIKSQLRYFIRTRFASSPPTYGALIVSTILKNAKLTEEWKECIREMYNRVQIMRKGLREKLESKNTPGTWNFITDHIGMFTYTGLSEKQVTFLKKKYHVYISGNGRIAMCRLNSKQLDIVAEAIHEALCSNLNGV